MRDAAAVGPAAAAPPVTQSGLADREQIGVAHRDALGLREHITREVTPGNRAVYESKVKPAFVQHHDRAPEGRREVRREIEKESIHQAWSALMETAQEIIWDSVGRSVECQLPDLNDKANRPRRRGCLTLDPSVKTPRHLSALDIHMMPVTCPQG